MKWELNGYTVIEESPKMERFCYRIIIDGSDVEIFYPDEHLTKSDLRNYLDECQDLVGTIGENERRFWIPLYIVYKSVIKGDWDDDEDIFSSYSLIDAEVKYNEQKPLENYEIMLLKLNKPCDFDLSNEIARDDYEVIKKKSLAAQY